MYSIPNKRGNVVIMTFKRFQVYYDRYRHSMSLSLKAGVAKLFTEKSMSCALNRPPTKEAHGCHSTDLNNQMILGSQCALLHLCYLLGERLSIGKCLLSKLGNMQSIYQLKLKSSVQLHIIRNYGCRVI